MDFVGIYRCICDFGYSGFNCIIDVNECDLLFCVFGMLVSYLCKYCVCYKIMIIFYVDKWYCGIFCLKNSLFFINKYICVRYVFIC